MQAFPQISLITPIDASAKRLASAKRRLPFTSNGLNTPADLLNFTLIHTERNLLTCRQWLADHQINADQELPGISLDQSEHAIEAAVGGVGIVLESDLLVSQELANGTLIPAFEEAASKVVS